MVGKVFPYGFVGTIAAATALFATSSAQAAIINLSCNSGGMLLTIDTNQKTITDDQPLIGSVVVSDLSESPEAYFWSENNANFIIERDTGLINGTVAVGGKLQALPLVDRHCVKVSRPVPKF